MDAAADLLHGALLKGWNIVSSWGIASAVPSGGTRGAQYYNRLKEKGKM
jgi:hypothetical protein